MEDKKCSGLLKTFEDVELETLLDEDSNQTQKEVAESLNVDRSMISRRLKKLERSKDIEYRTS